MNRIILFISTSLLLFAVTTFSNSKINSILLEKLNTANDNEQISIYVKFTNPLTLLDFNDISYDTPKKERRQIVINRLMNHANITQSRVRSLIQMRSSESQVIEQLWVVNTLIMSATPSVIYQLANDFSEVSEICFDVQVPIEQLRDEVITATPFMVRSAPEPGVTLMNADDVWALGNRGWGVVVANADDGFWWKHPDLVKGVWQNLGEDVNGNGKTVNWAAGTGSTFDPGDVNGIDNDGNGKVDDLIGWDFTTNNYNITTASHGSATMGHVIGDGTMGTQTGVAPWAKCIAMRNASGLSQQIAAFQYALLMGADIVTSSLSWKWVSRPDYSLMRLTTDMSLASGMIQANSTSNDGNSYGAPLNISSAGNSPAPWRHPDQLRIGNLSGVIGVGNVDVYSDVIVSSSPWGNSTWGNWALWNGGTWPYTIAPQHMDYPHSRVAPIELPDSIGLLKPDVSAPGQNSISTYVSSGTGYGGSFGGTSSATPHTAGCLALMLSINPEMLPADLDRVLELTAVEKGDPGKDVRYGAGRIDALLATTSPACLTEGVNGGNNWLLNSTTPPNDTARELVGLKLKNTNSPWIGSLRQMVFSLSGTATISDVEKFRLFWDVNKNNIVDAGDRLLSETPFPANNQFSLDTIKFKVTDSLRHVLLVAKTKPGATASRTVVLGMPNNTYLKSYYTTVAQATNFPYGSTLTGIGNNTGEPLRFALNQNFPNPFNPTTIINYTLAKQSLVKVRVYDAIGREIATLLNNVRDAGVYNIEFDAAFYKNLSSGIYFYKLEAFSPDKASIYFTDIKKMMLVK